VLPVDGSGGLIIIRLPVKNLVAQMLYLNLELCFLLSKIKASLAFKLAFIFVLFNLAK
jgi:hypothetical protein